MTFVRIVAPALWLTGCPEPVVDARFAVLEAEIAALQTQVADLQTQIDAQPTAEPTIDDPTGTPFFEYLQEAVDLAVPSGAMQYFDLTSCPPGWEEVPAARGRTIVGVVGSAGTLGGTVGESLGDLALPVPTHVHAVDPPSATTGSSGFHNHQWVQNGTDFYSSSGNTIAADVASYASGSFDDEIVAPVYTKSAADYYTSEEGSHTHTFDAPSIDSGPPDRADTLPYVQYLLCVRQ